MPAGTYLAYLSLEWMQGEEKARAVRQFVKQLPHFALAWKDLTTLAKEDSEKLAAIEKGLTANPDPQTKGMLRLNRALLSNKQGARDEAIRTLSDLASDPDSPLVIESLATTCLATIVQK